MHRTLTELIEKGMVRPSLDSPTTYAAVDLDTALDAALKTQESELREMETRKRELQELSKQQQFRPSDEVSTFKIIKSIKEQQQSRSSDEVATFKIIKSIKELVAAALPLLDSMKEKWLAAAPGLATVVASLFGIHDAVAEFIQRGGKVRTVVDISYPIIDNVRELLQMGAEVRHIDQHGAMFVAFYRKHV